MIHVIGTYSKEKIAKAAAEASNIARDPLPTLYCRWGITEKVEKRRGRVVFLNGDEQNSAKSHVCDHYRYGCLSEGKPRWEETQ